MLTWNGIGQSGEASTDLVRPDVSAMPERAPECWNGDNSFIRQRARFLHIGYYEHTYILARIPRTIDVTFRSIDIYNTEVFFIMVGFVLTFDLSNNT